METMVSTGMTPALSDDPRMSVVQLRKQFNLSQSQFAGALGVSTRAIQDWEQGRRTPSGPALALLRIIERHPELILQRE